MVSFKKIEKIRKRALITGITGQDGAYLAEFLIEKDYEVHGIKRRSSLINTQRVDHLYKDPHDDDVNFFMHYGDMTDSTNLIRILMDVKPHEIYNLAAQSHVRVSFDTPEYTANADAIGTLRMLEAMRILNLKDTRFYQASSSEMYGNSSVIPQNEMTPFSPRSPYGAAKLYSYWITINYREAYGFFASNGILFNHESPIRGETFVTRKITQAAANISLGLQKKLYLGNLDAKRDWGHSKDYVEAMWLILQHNKPDDFVIATGEAYSVREFAEMAFQEVGIDLDWHGKGIDEKGIDRKRGNVLIEVDSRYFRPTEIDLLIGDSTKARTILHWKPKYTLKDMVKEMVASDLLIAQKRLKLKECGFDF